MLGRCGCIVLHATLACTSKLPLARYALQIYLLLPDASSASALLSITKLPSGGLSVPRMPDPNLYVIRNKRRKMAITTIDIDPDAESNNNGSKGSNASGSAAGGSSGSGSKSAASLLCGGPSASSKPDLSF